MNLVTLSLICGLVVCFIVYFYKMKLLKQKEKRIHYSLIFVAVVCIIFFGNHIFFEGKFPEIENTPKYMMTGEPNF